MNWQDYEHKPSHWKEVEACAKAIVKRGRTKDGAWDTRVIETTMLKHGLARYLKPEVLDALNANWQAGRSAGVKPGGRYAL